MITIEKIKKWSKEHPNGGGRMTNIFNHKYELSIVGGRQGLYGDFEKTFEIRYSMLKIEDLLLNSFFLKMRMMLLVM